jgi:hypothetical protein
VIIASVPGVLFKAVVYFWAAGPQLVICLWLGYATCRRRRGRLLDWLIGGFAAALLPIAGVVVMAVLYRQAGRDLRGAKQGETGGSTEPSGEAGSSASAADPSPTGGTAPR